MNDIDPNVEVDVDVEGGNDSANIIIKAIGIVAAPIIAAITTHIIDKNHEKKEVIKAYEQGFEDASEIYENKFRKQTEEFLSKEKSWRENMEEYEALLDAYDEAINELKKKNDKSDDDKNEILFLKAKRKDLKKIKRAG